MSSDPLTKKIPLIECFGPTIQGEGRTIGQQTYFLRFGDCDYRCKMCDSLHAVLPEQIHKNAEWLTQDEILHVYGQHRDDLAQDSTNWVTLSGGNPCIHDLEHLCKRIKVIEGKIAVETQGTIFQEWLYMCDIVTVSPKGPGMGERFEFLKFDSFMHKLRDHEGLNIKVVIFNDQDIEFVSTEIVRWVQATGFPISQVFLSQGNPYPPGKPLSTYDAERVMNSHSEILKHNYLNLFDKLKHHPELSQFKFLPQFHVWLWSNRQGV